MDRALRDKIIPISWAPSHSDHAVVTRFGLAEAKRNGLHVVARIHPHDFRFAIKHRLGDRILDAAVHCLARRQGHVSARTRLTDAQIGVLILMIGSLSALAVEFSPANILAVASLLASLFFAIVVALRLYCLLPLDRQRQPRRMPLRDEALPVYSVLVPVFRETAVLDQLLHALTALDYPADKLDIKLILEEDDIGMQQALSRYAIPDFVEIIIVPSGKPQTKPRALNYALRFARGTLLTIYDSEDLPQPQQLRQAASHFNRLPDHVACLQAALVFYNSEENWLTRQFTAEYAALFKVVLPALAERELPLLLGGTSNHFRVETLKAVGAWDPFNVTEDADIGIRLARMGYATDVLDSETFEEANTAFFNWMKQRRRWFKGFLQTWLVHMRSPITLMRELGIHGFLVVQCMTIGIFASALLHPFLLVYSIFALSPARLHVAMTNPVTAIISSSCLLFLVLGYAVAIFASARGLRQLRKPVHVSTLVTLPIYWLMMSVAAWMSLWDFIWRPFHWHKTEHGLSRLAAKAPARR